MRALILSLALLAAACGAQEIKPVDPAMLPPLSGKERALLTAAEVAARNGEFGQAEQNYLSAVAASEGHVEAHLALADLYMKGQRFDQAKEVLMRARQYQPNHPAVNYLLGKIHLNQDSPSEALTAFNRGLVAEPSNPDLLNGAGIAHDLLRQHGAAQNLYQRAIAANPMIDLAQFKTNLGMSYLLANKPENAIAVLKEEVKKPTATATARHNLALAYGLLGRHTEAKKILKNELTEEQRKAALARLQAYIAQDNGAVQKVAPGIDPSSIIKAQ